MPFENSAGINVSNFYGPRNTGGAVGTDNTRGHFYQVVVQMTGESLQGQIPSPFFVLRGAQLKRAVLRVDEAFALTGTSPTVIIGGAAPATNGIVLSQTELQAVGTKTPASTGTGTWSQASATGTTATERVTRVLGGTTPAVSPTQGKATLVLEWLFVTKV